jgi:hypothetical protein
MLSLVHKVKFGYNESRLMSSTVLIKAYSTLTFHILILFLESRSQSPRLPQIFPARNSTAILLETWCLMTTLMTHNWMNETSC